MAKIAIPYWQQRVSPVFDAATRAIVVTSDAQQNITRSELVFAADNPRLRAQQLCQVNVDMLICGAISLPYAREIEDAGIELVPQICGQLDCVISAWLSGKLTRDEFLMPGCRGRGRGLGRGRNCQQGFQRRRRGQQNFQGD